jgi:hypothetical protein
VTHPSGRPPVRRHSTADIVFTAVMCVLTAVAALGSVWFSLSFVMATDSCFADKCDTSRLMWAYLVTWGGAGAAVLLAVVGTVIAANRATRMWVWPTLGLFLVIAALAGGAQVAASLIPAD